MRLKQSLRKKSPTELAGEALVYVVGMVTMASIIEARKNGIAVPESLDTKDIPFDEVRDRAAEAMLGVLEDWLTQFVLTEDANEAKS